MRILVHLEADAKETQTIRWRDLQGLELALQLAELVSGEAADVHVAARERRLLEEGLHIGASRGWLIAESGAEPPYGSYDLLIGWPELGGRPYLAEVSQVLEYQDKQLTVKVEEERRILKLRLALPAVIQVSDDVNTPRLPSYRRMLASRDEQIQMVDWAVPEEQVTARVITEHKQARPVEKPKLRLYEGPTGELAETLAATLKGLLESEDQAVQTVDPSGSKQIEILEVVLKTGEQDIRDAERIVVVGRGVVQGDLPHVERFAEAIGAEVACTRPLAQAGWFDVSKQIGVSGQKVAPKLLVTIGVSGAIQFVLGIKGAETVLAIDQDLEAPIWEVAQYGFVGDWRELVLPALTRLERGSR